MTMAPEVLTPNGLRRQVAGQCPWHLYETTLWTLFLDLTWLRLQGLGYLEGMGWGLTCSCVFSSSFYQWQCISAEEEEEEKFWTIILFELFVVVNLWLKKNLNHSCAIVRKMVDPSAKHAWRMGFAFVCIPPCTNPYLRFLWGAPCCCSWWMFGSVFFWFVRYMIKLYLLPESKPTR